MCCFAATQKPGVFQSSFCCSPCLTLQPNSLFRSHAPTTSVSRPGNRSKDGNSKDLITLSIPGTPTLTFKFATFSKCAPDQAPDISMRTERGYSCELYSPTSFRFCRTVVLRRGTCVSLTIPEHLARETQGRKALRYYGQLIASSDLLTMNAMIDPLLRSVNVANSVSRRTETADSGLGVTIACRDPVASRQPFDFAVE